MFKKILHSLMTFCKQEEGKIMYFICLLILLAIIIPIFIFKIYLLNEASALGDAIGGVLGTIISIIAALLVYITFKSQVKANEEITKQLSDERIFNIYNIFNKEQSDSIYKNINEKYQQCIITKNYSIKKEIIDETLFDSLTNLKKEIDDNKMIFENSKVLFNSFKKISNIKDEYHEIFYKKMEESLNVYFDYLKNFNHFSEIPIIKITNLKKVLEKNATFQISNFHKNIFKIKSISIIDENEENLKEIESEFEISEEVDIYVLDISELRNISIKIDWKIEYSNKLYIYNNKETYKINNS